MSEHVIVQCEKCSTVLRQCRCPGPHDIVKSGLCKSHELVPKIVLIPPTRTGPVAVLDMQGLTIRIENIRGSTRDGRFFMLHHYGEIEGTMGADGDPVDVFVGPDLESPMAVVIHQLKKSGEYDEDKVMLGFASADDAVNAYLAQYGSPDFYGGHDAVPVCNLLDYFLSRAMTLVKSHVVALPMATVLTLRRRRPDLFEKLEAAITRGEVTVSPHDGTEYLWK